MTQTRLAKISLAVGIACLSLSSHAQTVEEPRGAYYSAQMPYLPPLPFNPFPLADIVEVEPQRFVYDDTQVDYVSLRAWQVQSQQLGDGGIAMSMSGPPVPGPGGGGGTNIPPYIAPTVPIPGVPLLKIELLPTMPGMDKGVKLVSFNTKTNFLYRVEATTNLSNPAWTVIDEFVATDTNATFTADDEGGMQFYRVHQASDLFTFPDWFDRIEQFMEFKVKTTVTSGTISWELFADEVSVGNNTLTIPGNQTLTVYDPNYDPNAWPDTGLWDVAQWRLRVGVTPTTPPGTAAATTFIDVRKQGKQRNPKGTYHGALAQVYGIFSPFVQDDVDRDQLTCAGAIFQASELINVDGTAFWEPIDPTQIIPNCGLFTNTPERWTNLFNMITEKTTWLDYFHFMGHGSAQSISGVSNVGRITKKMLQNSLLKTNGMTYVALDACSTADGKDFLKAWVGYDKIVPLATFRAKGLDPAFACGWDRTKGVEFVNQTTRIDEHFWFWLDWYYDLTRRDQSGLMYKRYKQAYDFAKAPGGLSPAHNLQTNTHSKGFVMVGCDDCRFDERPVQNQ